MELQVRVIPDQPDWFNDRFKIQWRMKKRFNLFNRWRTLHFILGGLEVSIFSTQESALVVAKQIKDNSGYLAKLLNERNEFWSVRVASEKQRRKIVYL